MILNSNGILELAVQVNRVVVGQWEGTPQYAMKAAQVLASEILGGRPLTHPSLSFLKWTAKPDLREAPEGL